MLDKALGAGKAIGNTIKKGGLLGTALAPENLKGVYEGLNYANNVRKNLGASVVKAYGGLADTGAMIDNLGVSAVNYLGDTDIPKRTPFTQRYEPIKNWYDKNTELAIPTGENAAVDAATTFTEWAAGGPFKSDLYAGIGAATGEAITNYTDVPWLKEIMGLTGGFTGALRSGSNSADVVDSAAQQVIASKVENPADLQKAIVKGLRETPPTPANKGEWITPEGGWGEKTTSISANPRRGMKDPAQTMGDVTGDTNILGLENSVAGIPNSATSYGDIGTGTAMQKAIDESVASQQNAIVAGVTPAGPNQPPRVAVDNVQAQVDALRNDVTSAQEAVTKAEEVAAAAGKRFDGTSTSSQANKALNAAYKNLDVALKNKADSVWKEFDDAPPIDMRGVKDELKDYLDSRKMPAEMSKDLLKRYKDKVFSHVAKWGEKPIEPKSIQYVLTKIKDEVATAASNGASDVLIKEIGMFGTQLENILKASPVTSAYRKGVEATSELYKRARPPQLRKPRNALDDLFNYSGSKGGVTAQQVLDSADPQILAKSHDILRTAARKEGVTPAFMLKYEDYLRHPKFGRLKNEFTDIIAKQDLAAKAKGNLDTAVGLDKSTKANTLKKFADNPEEVIAAALKNTTKNTRVLKALVDDAVANKTQNSLKTLITEQVQKNLFGGGVKLKVNGVSADNFHKMRGTLVDAGVYTAKEADRMAAHLKRHENYALRKTASNEQITQTPESLEELTASVGALAAAKAMGVSSLTMVGALRRKFKAKALASKNSPAVLKRVEECLISPEKYLDGVKASENLEQNINTIFTQVMGGSIALDSNGDDEQEQR